MSSPTFIRPNGLVLLIVLLSFLVGACSGEGSQSGGDVGQVARDVNSVQDTPSGLGCEQAGCVDGERCYRGVCYPHCEGEAQCTDEARCYQGHCAPLDCSSVECAPGESCYRGVCYHSCQQDAECGDELACVQQACVDQCEEVGCAAGESCYRGVCYPSCDVQADCDDEHRCDGARCAPVDCQGVQCRSDESCHLGVCSTSCQQDADCQAQQAVCEHNVCVVASCHDGIQNGEETGVDCGGRDCPACGTGVSCVVDTDCQTGRCEGGVCGSGFVTVWNTALSGDTASDQVRLPLVESGSYDFEVNWGDGTTDRITNWDQPERTHTYDQPGTYTVFVDGEIQGWSFAGGGDAQKLVEIKSWQPLRLGNEGGYLHGASNLEVTATDVLDLTGTTSLEDAFRGCASLTAVPSMNEWDVSAVTTMKGAFQSATNFNQDIGGWDVSAVTDMGWMFYEVAEFNQDIGAWDVSQVTTLRFTFTGAESFDQDIGGWDVSAVTDMNSLFARAYAFDQDIGQWDVSKVTDMAVMFRSTEAFNQDIGGWDTSAVNWMHWMFLDSQSFDQDIGAWNVGQVTSMGMMFMRAQAFDQDIGGWDTSAVTSMAFMFKDAAAFDQDIGGWDVSAVLDMEQMLDGVTLSTTNYDALLAGWAQLDVQPGIDFHAGDSRYSAGAPANARSVLTGPPNNWTITDGGQQ